MLRTIKWLPVLACVLAWGLSSPGEARASFMVVLSGGGVVGGPLTFMDNDNDGIISAAPAAQNGANTAIIAIQATSIPVLGSPTQSTITLDVSIIPVSGGTFTLPSNLVATASNDMLTMPAGGGDFDTSGTLTRNSTSASGQADWEATAAGTTLQLLGYTVAPGGNNNDVKDTFSDPDTIVGAPGPLTATLTITSANIPLGGPSLSFNGVAQVVSQNPINPVPAPGGFALVLTTLPALGLAGWMRRRKRGPASESAG